MESILFQLNKFDTWYHTCGPQFAAKRVKLFRLVVLRYLSGKPVRPGELDLAVTFQGLPKGLAKGFKMKLQNPTPDDVRIVLTILSLSRGILGTGQPDMNVITTASKSSLPGDLNPIVMKFFQSLSVRKGSVPLANSYH